MRVSLNSWDSGRRGSSNVRVSDSRRTILSTLLSPIRIPMYYFGSFQLCQCACLAMWSSVVRTSCEISRRHDPPMRGIPTKAVRSFSAWLPPSTAHLSPLSPDGFSAVAMDPLFLLTVSVKPPRATSISSIPTKPHAYGRPKAPQASRPVTPPCCDTWMPGKSSVDTEPPITEK